MPSLDHCVNNQSEMTTLTKTLEVFDTYKHREDKDSDEESFHLPLDDDETDPKVLDTTLRNGSSNDTEEEILNKFDNTPAVVDNIDSQTEERLLNDDEEEKEEKNDEKSKLESQETVDNEKQCENENQTDFEDQKDKNELNDEENLTNGAIQSEPTDPTLEKASIDNIEQAEDKEHTDSKETESNDSSQENNTSPVETNDVPKVDDIEKISAIGDLPDSETGVCDTNDESSKNGHEQKSEEEKNNWNEETKKSETSRDLNENSNDSSKQNEDSEDLFDISIIRDAEEDNAESAYNEANNEENQAEENEEFDDRHEERTVENINSEAGEDEEMDSDKQDDHLKSDEVDIEEDNLKLDCDVNKDLGSDVECESTRKSNSVQSSTDNQTCDASNGGENNVAGCRLDEVTGNMINIDESQISCEEEISDNKSEEVQHRNLKRPLVDEGESGFAKKQRTDNVTGVVIKEVEKPKEKLPLRNLLSLQDFMKNKKSSRRLTLHDLEEFCLQKICEVIVHKSELGDVHHQLKVQEQLIETMRKEIQQLTKQARDLEIVNKKLLNDLKQQTTTQKPLNPLKITRSVGLQVKFTPNFEANLKRRQSNGNVVSPKVPSQQNLNRSPRAIPNAATPPTNRQIMSPQKQQPQQQQLPKPTTPLLSQALQNRRTGAADSSNKVNNQIVRTKPTEVKRTPTSASVIDLTDEDDKKDKNKNMPTPVVPSKNIAVPLRTTPVRVNSNPQGIRLTTPQGKVCSMNSVASSTPQLMYVVQSSPQNVLTPVSTKTVLVNFTSNNGILTSALNGSSVSVIPKQSNTLQLKTVGPPKPIQNNKVVKVTNKHPAPLPPPPVVRVNSEKPLKPIPPKPHLTIRKTETGIILQWKMPYELDKFEVIASYQLYAYQETSALPSTDMWRKVGDVKALALPMACTLTQFADKFKYYFAVRPVDIHKRIGMFSEPEEISLL